MVSSGGGDWCGCGDRCGHVCVSEMELSRCVWFRVCGFFFFFFFPDVDLYIYFLDLLGLIY